MGKKKADNKMKEDTKEEERPLKVIIRLRKKKLTPAEQLRVFSHACEEVIKEIEQVKAPREPRSPQAIHGTPKREVLPLYRRKLFEFET